jgi:hypothetical protein
MHWIIQKGFHSEPGISALMSTLDRYSVNHSVHRVVRTGPTTVLLEPDVTLTHRNVICFGTFSLRYLAQQRTWSPGVFDLLDLHFERQREHWGHHLLNFESTVTRVCDAETTLSKVFVRPMTQSLLQVGYLFAKTFISGSAAFVVSKKQHHR